jgi:hypothetical protein
MLPHVLTDHKTSDSGAVEELECTQQADPQKEAHHAAKGDCNRTDGEVQKDSLPAFDAFDYVSTSMSNVANIHGSISGK